MSIYKIPLSAEPQSFSITLNDTEYTIILKWVNADSGGGWTIDIEDLIYGIPLVTGADLLAQYEYLGIGGSLYVYNSSDKASVPTYSDLGTITNLYFVVDDDDS